MGTTVNRLFHVTTPAAAARGAEQGWYEPEGFDREGFIHCAFATQVDGVLERYFSGRVDLVILEIDPAALEVPVVEENLLGGAELFPHLYGKLRWSAVRRVHPLPRASGRPSRRSFRPGTGRR